MRVLLCPMNDLGYLYPAIAVGRELQRRGAQVHVLATEKVAPLLAATGIPLLAAESYGGQQAFMVARRVYNEEPAQYQAIRRAAREVQADVLVTSILCNGALLAAETLDLPVVVIGFAAHLWAYKSGGETEPDSASAGRAWLTRELLDRHNDARRQLGLPTRPPEGTDLPLLGTALLLRGDPAFEHPGAVLPDRVHHVGPCTWEPQPHPAVLQKIMDRLDQVGKPVVYVHLGRTFGGESPWPRINAAFTGGPFQAVVEQGRSHNPQPAPDADIILVRKTWMGPLIDRAGLVLTAGTSTPVLNALLRGRPLGVSPMGSEQPLLARACVRAGVAAYIPPGPDHDHHRILRSIWHDGALRTRAGELRDRLATAGGACRAAGIVEQIVTGRHRVTASTS